jgi:filamentous hemagglutinin
VSKVFTGAQIAKKPIPNCDGCWRAQTSDGAWVTYRPAGQASGATVSTKAIVEINSTMINNSNANGFGRAQVLKLKFPVKSEVNQ